MNGMRIVHGEPHGRCQCERCEAVARWPEMPAMRPLPDASGLWTVDCHWVSPLRDGCGVEIRRGFVTDGASVPRLAWRVVGHPFIGDLLPFALGHDALYAGELLEREACDRWFLECMAAGGVGLIRRRAIWAAVRAAGWAVWGRHTRESVAASRGMCRLVGSGKEG